MRKDVARTRQESRIGGRTPRGLPGVLAVIVVIAAMAAVSAPFWLHSSPSSAETSSAVPSPTLSSPSASPSGSAGVDTLPPLAEASAAPLPAKCESDPLTTTYEALGWRGNEVAVLANHFVGCGLHQEIISADPVVGKWRSVAGLDFTAVDYTMSDDGSSLAMPSENGIVVIDPAGVRHDIPRPDAARPDFGANGLPVLPGGGYLVTGADKLYRVATDGSRMSVDALPSGYVAVAPTSDPNLYLLTPAQDAEGLYSLSARNPFRVYLWNLRTGHLTLAASSVAKVESSTDSLAYLSQSDGWLSLAADGSAKAVARPSAAAISPDGSRYIWIGDPVAATEVTIEFRSGSTDQVLAQFKGYNAPIVWTGNVAAMVSGPDLVVLDDATVTRVPLP